MFRPGPTLTFNNAKAVLDAGSHAIAMGETRFDLAALTAVDSAAVATLLEWQRAARRAGKNLILVQVPANLQNLIRLYGVADLLHYDSPSEQQTDLLHH